MTPAMVYIVDAEIELVKLEKVFFSFQSCFKFSNETAVSLIYLGRISHFSGECQAMNIINIYPQWIHS